MLSVEQSTSPHIKFFLFVVHHRVKIKDIKAAILVVIPVALKKFATEQVRSSPHGMQKVRHMARMGDNKKQR